MAFVLTCSDLTKAFGSDVIFDHISFQLEENEKLGILGSNGTGKSTLLKCIVGEMTPDSGTVTLASGKKLGYLAQYQKDDWAGNIYDIVLSARQDLIREEEELRDMEEEMSRVTGDALNQLIETYHVKSQTFEEKGGLVFRSQAAGVLKGLGFSEEDFSKSMDQLSGGQKTRVSLSRLLSAKPDVLLLDEPINHLDLHSIEWLETFLANYSGAVILVAHDRYFLNRTIDHALDLSMHPAHLFTGNYKAYTEQKRELLITLEREYEKQQKEIAHQEAVITRLQSFNREKSIKRAESRKKVLDKMERMERPKEEDTGMKLVLEPNSRSGNDVLTVTNLSKSFDDRLLFKNLNFQIRRQERVAILGDNGTGKTTTLKIINGILPADSGSVHIGTGVTIGYYDQEQQNLNEDATLFEELQNAYPNLNNTRVRSILAAFRFKGDHVYKKIRELSGGERGRVSLAKLMLSGANFLILDEPTNHLDMESKEILEEALNAYTGTLLYVSHDRYFINQTAKRILEIHEDGMKEYLGNYDYYLEKKAEEDLTPSSASAEISNVRSESEKKGDPSAEDSKDSGLDYQEQKRKKAARKKVERALASLEEEISKREERIREIDKAFTDESIAKNSAKLNELTNERSDLEVELEDAYAKWESLSMELDAE